jgi:3-oxoacyl-[acyl-carrier protein] reductase
MELPISEEKQMTVLEGKVAVVTGASRGIGAAIAARLAAAGAAVVIHGRDEHALDGVRAAIVRAGGRAEVVTAELTAPDQVSAMASIISDRLGCPDILVANAGGNPVRPGPVEKIAYTDWQASIASNLTATFLTIQAFLPAMREHGRGTIVTMSSAAARRPTVQSPVAYLAAKAGIEALTQAVALQAGPDGIRANCLAPETIMTERNEQQIPGPIREQLIAAHPIRRLGTPDDVASAVLFLATDASSWISGTTIDIAGGSVLR